MIRLFLIVTFVAAICEKERLANVRMKDRYLGLKERLKKSQYEIQKLKSELLKAYQPRRAPFPHSFPSFPQPMLKKLLTTELYDHYTNVIGPYTYESEEDECHDCYLARE